MQGEAREPHQRPIGEAAAQHRADGEGESGIEEEDQPGELSAGEGPGSEAAPEDRQTATDQTMKIGRSSFWWKCHG